MDNKDTMWFLFESLATGDPSQAILNQEKKGQMEQAESQTLPIECPREELEELGFVFGERVDDLFISVIFPEGWYKRPTEHSMHTDLMDNLDRQRGGIFYKAAFYDRRAHMHLNRRYSYRTQPIGGYDQKDYHTKPYESVVLDDNNIIWRKGEVDHKDYSALHELEDEAKAWLEENYPDYADVLAYW